MFKNENVTTNKAEITRENLYRAALELFTRKGYEGTSMREIAKQAGVATGATYYYFSSKDALIFEYYKNSHADHIKELGDYLQTEKNFAKRLRQVLMTKIQVAQPYKHLARALFRVAANPESPMSPFSKESEALRIENLQLIKDVVTGSDEKFHKDILPLLPEYLWLFQMGVILFWIYDESPDGENTFKLIDQSVNMIDSTNKLLSSAWAKPFRGQVTSLLKNFKPVLSTVQSHTKENL